MEQTEKNGKRFRILLIIVAAVVIIIAGIIAATQLTGSGATQRRIEKQLSLGEKYLSEMNYKKAIAVFKKAIEIDPKNVDAYIGLAEAYIGNGDEEKAREILETAEEKIREAKGEELSSEEKRKLGKAKEKVMTPVPTNTPTPTQEPTSTPTPTSEPSSTPTPKPIPTGTPTPTPISPTEKLPTSTPTPMPESGNGTAKWVDDNHTHVYFGSYPQSEVTGSDLTNAIISASYDENGDATVNGVKYRRLSKEDVTFDCYDFYGETYESYFDWSDGGYHYFRYEPIKWRVLSNSNGELFLLSENNLDTYSYHEKWEGVTWETCTLRSRLNGYGSGSNLLGLDYSGKGQNFLSMAFTAGEQKNILQKTIRNEGNPGYGTEGGNNTKDKVFLLSIEEASNPTYGLVRELGAYEEDRIRIAYNTEFCKAMGSMTEQDAGTAYHGAGWWWLRSPGCYGYDVVSVDYHGDVYNYGSSGNSDINAIRPALFLNLDSVIQ